MKFTSREIVVLGSYIGYMSFGRGVRSPLTKTTLFERWCDMRQWFCGMNDAQVKLMFQQKEKTSSWIVHTTFYSQKVPLSIKIHLNLEVYIYEMMYISFIMNMQKKETSSCILVPQRDTCSHLSCKPSIFNLILFK